MTYCLAIAINEGLVFSSDSRTNAGADQVRTYSKMRTFGVPGDRQFVLLSAGNLATCQGVIAQLERDISDALPRSLLSVRNMSEAADHLSGISIGQQRALGSLSTEMSRSEKLKEEIGWLKVVFGILAAIDVSLLAWLAQNYRSANALLLVIGALAVAGITAAVVWVNHRAYQKIDELEEL